MTRIKGYGFTRKDKVFAEFETDSGKYLFKESHTSHKGNYSVGIYAPSGKKLYEIDMTREQINKIKSGSGITNINFISEEGFNNYIRSQYVDKDFDEDKFRSFFKNHFIREYEEMNSEKYSYYDGKDLVEGSIEEHYVEYIAYLIDKTPSFVLENIYNENPDVFRKTFKYRDKEITKMYLYSPNRAYGERFKFLDTAKAEILQTLNSRNIPYASYDEFVEQGLYENYKAVSRSPFK